MITTLFQRFQQRERIWEEYSSELFVFKQKKEKKLKKKNLREIFSEHYLQVSDKEIKENEILISQFLKGNNIDFIVPMKEKKGIIKNLLNYAIKRISPNSILIINDESKEEVLREIRKFKNVRLINKEEILRVINWKKLLPILNLSYLPRGKGTAVMAGYLFSYFEGEKRKEKKYWIFQTDADIKNHQKFKPIEYLTFGIIKQLEAFQIKLAQAGRNNEANMAVRSVLVILEDLKKAISNQGGKEFSKRAKELFENLAKYKWILGGTFAIPEKIAFERPFATGYLDETLICAFIEDKARKENGFSIQVSNFNPCSDGENNFKKENIIVQMTANFIMILLLAKKPVCDWTLDDITWINKNLMSKSRPIVLIPPKEDGGPVIVENIANERILPSIKMMVENGLIDFEKVKKFIKKTN